MIRRALAALALGGSLVIPLTGSLSPLDAAQQAVTPPEIIERYHQALATDPGNLTLHYLLGLALLQNNLNEAALAELKTAYPAYQHSVEAHYNLAIASLRQGDLVSTEIYLEQAIALGAKDMQGIYPVAGLYFNMALASQNAGDANEAIRYFLKTLALDSERYEVYRQLGDLYAQQNDIDLAVKSFHAYLERFPDDPISRDYLFALEFNRAQDYLALDDMDNAVVGFTAALKLQPDSPTALYYLGYIAYTQAQPMHAASLLRKAYTAADTNLRKTIRPLLYNTALSLWESGKFNAANDAVSVLADQDHALFNELFLAGTLNLDIGRYRAAHEYLQRAILINPQDPGARQNIIVAEQGAFKEWMTIAKLRFNDGDIDTAERALDKARQLQPRNAKIATLRGRIDQARLNQVSELFFNAQMALDSGDLTTALQQVDDGLRIQPENSDGLALQRTIRQALEVDLDKLLGEGRMELQAGNLGSAEEIFSRVLDISPQHPDALSGQEEIVNMRNRKAQDLLVNGQRALDSGDTELAAKLFKQLIAMAPDNDKAHLGLDSARQMQANRLDELLTKGRQALERDQYAEAREWFEQARNIDETQRTEAELVTLEKRIRQKADELASQAERAIGKGNFKQGQKLYTKALTLDPAHKPSTDGLEKLASKLDTVVNTRLEQAGEAFKQSDYSAAMAGYRSVLDINPDHGQALDGLKRSREEQAAELAKLVKQGEIALQSGELEKAREYLTAALKQDSYHKEAQQLRQRLELVLQSGAQPGDEQKLYLQGVAYYTQGKYVDAIKSWETVLMLDPSHEKSLQNITKTRLKVQQIKEYSGG